jgi:hypothetical protein
MGEVWNSVFALPHELVRPMRHVTGMTKNE